VISENRTRHGGIPLRLQGNAALTALLTAGLCLMRAGVACAGAEGTLAGRVVDKSGAGVAAAKVWAIRGTWVWGGIFDFDEARIVAETTVDGRGKFVLPNLPAHKFENGPWLRSGAYAFRYYLLARAGDGRLAWLDSDFLRRQDPTNIDLDLVEVTDARGRLVDQDGRPIAGAEVIPVHVSRERGIGSNGVPLPDALTAQLHATTAADGSFVLKGIPRNAELGTRINAPVFGSPLAFWPLAEPVTIVLDRRLGRIAGRFKTSDQHRLDGAPALRLVLFPLSGGRGFGLGYSRRIQVGSDGSFQFHALPPARYSITPELVADPAFVASQVDNIVVGPGAEVTGLEIPLQSTVTITGRVVDAETEKGIAGVTVNGNLVDRRTRFVRIPPAETDSDGRYHIRVPRGEVTIAARHTAGAYTAPRSSRGSPRLEVVADRTWPDLKLSRATVIDGVVLDGGGQPVPGAEVFVEVLYVGGGGSDEIRTGSDGSFRLVGLSPNDLLALRARAGGATTDGAIALRARDQIGKLALTVDPKFTFRLRGTVADDAGRPIAEARLRLFWRRRHPDPKMPPGTGGGRVLEGYAPDAAGRFESGPLWPGDAYHFSVSAKGYTRFETPPVMGQPGMMRGIGTIKLVGAGGHVAGRVVGSEGKPIAGATVFNRGNSIQPASVTTDLQGRYRLDGLLPGRKYAFARKDGYRFTGVRVEADTDDLTIRLLRSDEPPPAWSPGETSSANEQRELAKRILVRLWEFYASDRVARGNDRALDTFIGQMARIDPELALTWSAELGGRNDAYVRLIAAESVAEANARDAIALIKKEPDRFIQQELQKLSELFADSDPSKALVFAEEAVVHARAMTNAPERVRAMARAGTLLSKSGRADAGKRLVEDAAEALSRLRVEDGNVADSAARNWALTATVAALAPFDQKRAQILVESILEPQIRRRIPALLALGIAATDPARAVALVDTLPGQSPERYLLRMEIVYRSGGEHPDEALRIIEGMQGNEAIKYQSEALGWLAVALAKHDPKRAFALIDRALALPIDRQGVFLRWDHSGGATGTATRIAVCARRVAYPDMDSVVARVLATRHSPDHYSSIPRGSPLDLSDSAALLALTAPAAAGEMLRQITASQGSLPNPGARGGDNRWLIAWALADLKHAQTLVDSALATLDEPQGASTQGSLLLRLAGLLAAPTSRRAEILWGPKFDTWYPGRNVPDF
jgi:hypothetical protein